MKHRCGKNGDEKLYHPFFPPNKKEGEKRMKEREELRKKLDKEIEHIYHISSETLNKKVGRKKRKCCANCIYYDIYEEVCTFWIKFFGYGIKKYPTETCIFMG